MKALKILLAALVVATFLVAPLGASLSPATVTKTVEPGDSFTETKTVTVSGLPPKVDVLFAFDTTGSMVGIISNAQSNAGSLLSYLRTTYPDVDFQFGVVSGRDYGTPPFTDTTCGYTPIPSYGDSGDTPYELDQSITPTDSFVTTAIAGLSAHTGGDEPEAYGRLLWETYTDPGIGWRTGAKRVVLHFGDSLPHDCNVNDGNDALPVLSTGADPGPNGIAGDGDDLIFLNVLNGLATNNIVFIESQTGTVHDTQWTYWTGLIEGSLVHTPTFDVPTIANAIVTGASSPDICGLTLDVKSGPGWLTSVVPASYGCFPSPFPGTVDKTFDITITVPSGTAFGTYTMIIEAVDSTGVSYGEQTVTINVADLTPPVAACPPGPNPADKIPPAKGGQRPDGFFTLAATDNLDPSPQVFLTDTGSGTVFGPFASGTNIKYTQAPGATPSQKPMAGVVQWHITGTGDAAVSATDASGNVAAAVSCLVPPPPK